MRVSGNQCKRGGDTYCRQEVSCSRATPTSSPSPPGGEHPLCLVKYGAGRRKTGSLEVLAILRSLRAQAPDRHGRCALLRDIAGTGIDPWPPPTAPRTPDRRRRNKRQCKRKSEVRAGHLARPYFAQNTLSFSAKQAASRRPLFDAVHEGKRCAGGRQRPGWRRRSSMK